MHATPDESTPLPTLLTLRELAVYLRYACRQSAHNFVVRNGLRRLRRGRVVLIRRADVDAVIEGRKRTRAA
jgi:hypothetical protein